MDMSPKFSLNGKNALITGGTRGIGLAIARGYLSHGSRVTICSRKQANVDSALAELSEFGDSVQGVEGHAGEPEASSRCSPH